MAKGRSWAKQHADEWVERWWETNLTSAKFVEVEQLPISARSLRAHHRRRFAEVLAEWKAMHAGPGDVEGHAAKTEAPGPAESPEGDHAANDTASEPDSEPMVDQMVSAAPLAAFGGTDFSNLQDPAAAPAVRRSVPFDWTDA